ncbi:MAG: dephospho-CoA kinase [Candidatus Tokpelaia sp. JSC188]|nr:MAG: dephospho-CoA kinase [Candidatus Tokpelaia sp. JSC188]
MIILGLTGSIGMGKSTIAHLLSEAGIPIYSADDAIHALYQEKSVVKEIDAAFPEAIENNAIDIKKLSTIVFGKLDLLNKLESIMHPRVYKLETEFLQKAQKQGHEVAVLDIPLLFENGRQSLVDRVVVVSAPFEIQHKRVLRRPGMTNKKFSAILSRQIPDEKKCKQADFVVSTVKNIDTIREEIYIMIKALMVS